MSEAAIASGVVDALVHPAFAHQDELREYMREPYRSRPLSGVARWFYPAPKSELRPGLADGPAAADPSAVAQDVLHAGGADAAVLLPLTRGLIPDIELGSEVCTATNAWLADRWLDGHADAGRFLGSIRVNADDPPRAIAEIERWAEHPRMVQVAVTLQSRAPYGQRQYRPIWEAAAHHGLPVAVKLDRADGINFPPTSIGYPTHFIEFESQYSLAFSHHLLSLIAEGVLEDIEVKFVFADGGLDLAIPILWRADKDWRPSRPEVPWVTRFPSAYARERVRFIASGFEGPGDPAEAARWLAVSGAAELLLHASRYPYVGGAARERYGPLAEAIMAINARRLYGLAP
jgi:predicted TIM-barrel fold metal-dependent hydrolase